MVGSACTWVQLGAVCIWCSCEVDSACTCHWVQLRDQRLLWAALVENEAVCGESAVWWANKVAGATERMKVKKKTEWIYEQRVIASLIKMVPMSLF